MNAPEKSTTVMCNPRVTIPLVVFCARVRKDTGEMESRAKVFLDLSPFSSEDVRNEFLRMLKAVKKIN